MNYEPNHHDELIARHIELYRRQAYLGFWQAVAGIVVVGVVFFGGVIAVSNWVRPWPQTITVHLVNETPAKP